MSGAPATLYRLLEYQVGWLLDRSLRKLLTKARGIGMSYAATLGAVSRALGLDLPTGRLEPWRAHDQVIVSTGDRFAAELLELCTRHLAALEARLGVRLVKSASTEVIRLRNGPKILGLPGGNASALHGWRGSVLVDEAARVPGAEALFEAVVGVAAPTPAQPEGYALELVTTPAGPSGLFHRLWTGDAEGWSRHTVDIYRARDAGFPIDPERERARLGDEALFRSLYCCDFTGGDGQWIPGDLYASCEVGRDEVPRSVLLGARRVAGFDIGLKHDASAAVEGVVDGDGVLWLLDCSTARGAGAPAQRKWLHELAARGSRVAADATGLGLPIVDEVRREVGNLEGVVLSSKTRDEVLSRFRALFVERRIRVARDLRAVSRAVLSVRKEVTGTEQLRVTFPRKADGHADAAMAAALCAWAGRGMGRARRRVLDNTPSPGAGVGAGHVPGMWADAVGVTPRRRERDRGLERDVFRVAVHPRPLGVRS